MGEQPTHSPTGASSMYRWEACPGSVALCATVPPAPSSSYAEEGTKAHAWAAFCLETGALPMGSDVDLFQHNAQEMKEAVRTYVDVCGSYYTPAHQNLGAKRWIEHKLDASRYIPGMYGTVDCLIYWPWLKKLIVIDFKYGSGVYVGVKDNSQLLYYAVAAQLALDFFPPNTVECTELVIVQPRFESGDDGGVRRVEITDVELGNFLLRVKKAINATRDPKAPLNPGEHCRFCPAAAVCPELGKARDLALLSDFGKPVEAPQGGYSPETIKKALDSLDALKAYIKAVDELAYRELEAGREIPGYKLVAKRPTRKIPTDYVDVVVECLCGAGYSEIFLRNPPELKSPAQLEKVIKKEDRPLIAPYIISESSGHVVVPESDPRPAIEGRNATTDFLSLRALGIED